MKNTSSLSAIYWINFLIILSIRKSKLWEILEAEKEKKGFKANGEAELSFFTENLGFANDDYLQEGTPSEHLMRELLQRQAERQVIVTKITKTYFADRYSLCKAYLSDAIFKDNFVLFSWDDDPNEILYELKVLKFHYFSRNVELIKAVRCPVAVSWKRTRLYFIEVSYNFNKVNGPTRGIFVFKSFQTKENEDPLLELLMFSVDSEKMFPDIDTNGDEVEIRDARNRRIPSIDIDFRVNFEPVMSYYQRLFEKKAETLFLMTIYGFLHLGETFWESQNLVEVLERMRKGYEINAAALINLKNENEKDICDSYVFKSFPLIQQGILFNKKADASESKWTNRLVTFSETKIAPKGRSRELLQCPITYGGEARLPDIIYLLPITYFNIDKYPQLFTFMKGEILTSEESLEKSPRQSASKITSTEAEKSSTANTGKGDSTSVVNLGKKTEDTAEEKESDEIRPFFMTFVRQTVYTHRVTVERVIEDSDEDKDEGNTSTKATIKKGDIGSSSSNPQAHAGIQK